MGVHELYEKFPIQTSAVSFLVAGLVAPILAALVGATKTLNNEILHDKKNDYRAQDKIHEFAVTFYCMTDVALAGFLVNQLRSAATQNLHAAWVAVATHQVSYLFAATSSFGFQKTMLPSLSVAGIATYMAFTTSSSKASK